MSEGYYDDEVAEITVRFRGLVVTVSGPPSQASQLVEDLAHLAARRRPSSPARSAGSFSAVSLPLLLAGGRPERRLHVLSQTALTIYCHRLLVLVVIWTLLATGCAELGLQASGPVLSCQTGWDRPTGQSRFERALRNSSRDSFPSETEARIYCEGAGVAYPGL